MQSSVLTLLFLLISLAIFGQSNPQFSRTEVLADLATLREAVTEAHYDPYAYTTPAALDSAYRAVRGAISQDSLDLLATTNLFQRFVSEIHNGHTSIDFPIQPYVAYAYGGGTVFPLELAFEAGRSLVRKNWSDNDSIPIGAEVLSINGLPMATILDRLFPQIAAERPYFARAKIELYSFPRYYWQVFGEQAEFTVTIRAGEILTTYTLPAVSAIEGYEMQRTEVIDPKMELAFFGSAAYLNPGGFGGDEARYRRFIDSAFAEIKAVGSHKLIIDLRNNPGGDDAFSDYLVSYIADRPFQWNARFALKSSRKLKDHVRANQDTTTAYAQAILSHRDGETFAYDFPPYDPQPASLRFSGAIYVLVNRQSHSQAAVTAAQLQDYGFGTIVGEETGDFPSLYASIFPYTLPNTGITAQISKGYIVRVNGSTAAEGVVPDIMIRDHLLDGEDEILTGLLEQLGEEE